MVIEAEFLFLLNNRAEKKIEKIFDLKRLHGVFAQCWRARQRNVFFAFAFQGHLKPSKGNEQGMDYRLL